MRKSRQNKKPKQNAWFLICNNFMAGHVTQNWNTIQSSLVRMYEKLVTLGLDVGLEES